MTGGPETSRCAAQNLQIFLFLCVLSAYIYIWQKCDVLHT